MKNDSPQFQEIFGRMKAILQKYADELVVKTDEPGDYYLNAAYSDEKGKEVFFGAAKIQKRYVSYYLMPVYAFPDLLEGISPALRRRMQGKSCFNLRGVDEALLKELAGLTQKGFERYKKEGVLP